MKLLVGVVVVLLAAGGLALVLMRDPGYVLIGYGHWTVETSVAVAAAVAAILFAVLYYALRTVSNLRRLPTRVQRWRRLRHGERARRSLSRGLVQLAEGNWQGAERTLLRHVDDSDTALLNYLGAARAAQQRGDSQRRDYYLQQAHKHMPEADIAVGLTQADLQLAQGQYEQALATAMHLQQVAPHHAHVLKLLAKLYRQLNDWERLRQLLPELRKRKVFADGQLEQLTRQVHLERLAAAAGSHDLTRLRETWSDVPRDLRRDASIIAVYVRHLLTLGEGAAAERLLAEALDQGWDEELIRLYGLAEAADAGQQLSRAENWLKQYPHDRSLLLTLARLALRNRLWGKARIYLESSIGHGAQVEAYRDMGALLERMGDRESAMEYYRKGVELALGNTPLLPVPAEPEAAVPESGESAS